MSSCTLFSSRLGTRKLPLNRRQTVFANGTLHVDNVFRDEDQGEYRCQVHDQLGRQDEGRLHVRVLSKLPPTKREQFHSIEVDFIFVLQSFAVHHAVQFCCQSAGRHASFGDLHGHHRRFTTASTLVEGWSSSRSNQPW